MDDPGAGRDDLARSLAFIRRVNERMGGTGALLRRLRPWSARWPRDRPVTLLDVATGSADIPVAARRWARSAGFDLRITGVDAHPTTLDLARDFVREAGEEDGVQLVRADALALDDAFAPGSFDYAHAGMFLHHLSDDDAVRVLRSMHRIASRGLIWNDLVRSPAALAYIRLATLGKPRMIRHDTYVSVRAGFTKRESLGLARRAGLGYVDHEWRLLTHRFTVAGEKPGAWGTGPA